jgi:hypothetical protein
MRCSRPADLSERSSRRFERPAHARPSRRPWYVAFIIVLIHLDIIALAPIVIFRWSWSVLAFNVLILLAIFCKLSLLFVADVPLVDPAPS